MVSITDLFYGSTPTPQGQVMMQGGNGRGQPNPATEKTYCYIVYGQKLPLTQNAINWYRANNVSITPCNGSTPTSTPTNSALEARVEQLELVQKTYPQMPSASQKSDADIWAHLDEHVWSNPPYNNPDAIKPTLDKAVKEHDYFHTQLKSLGDSLTEHNESWDKHDFAKRTHVHKNGGGGKGKCPNPNPVTGKCSDKCPTCDEWDVPCEMFCGWDWDKVAFYLKIALAIIGIGLLLWLLRPLFGLIGAFKGGAP